MHTQARLQDKIPPWQDIRITYDLIIVIVKLILKYIQLKIHRGAKARLSALWAPLDVYLSKLHTLLDYITIAIINS